MYLLDLDYVSKHDKISKYTALNVKVTTVNTEVKNILIKVYM